LAGAPAWAQPAASPTSPADAPPGAAAAPATLRAALDAAWSRAVAAREAEGQRRRADADIIASSRLWASAPTLEVSHRDDRLQSNVGRREAEVGIAVPLWLPGQKAARSGSAEAAIAQAQSAVQVARLRLAGELREVAWLIAGLQAEVRQAELQAKTLRQLADDVDRRVRAGDLARADSLAAQAEFLAASAASADAGQRLRSAQARWTLLTGLTALPSLPDTVVPDAVPVDVATHPERVLASQSTELARKRLDLVRHSRRAAPELTVGVRQDMPGRGEASQGSFVVGLRLPIGTDDRNRPLEAAALADLDIARVNEQRLQERLESDIASAREAQRSAQAQFEAATTRAQLLRERAALIDKSFRAGETPLPDLLRALAVTAEADSAAARQAAALGLARARLQQALGLLP
jgi:outer membrane protein TolC